MRFLIRHSDRFRAATANLPLAGSEVEVATLEELLALQQRFGHGLVLHPPGYGAPWWADTLDLDSEEECSEQHCVRQLPDDWKALPWLEIYNGYRE